MLDKSLSILENEFRLHRITVKKELAREMPDTLLDGNQVEQVFVNVLINAVHAIGEQGEIAIQSRVNRKEGTIVVDISDTGCGIPAENLSKIFEPFFSTKPKGTGLGLAVSYGIVKNHKGDIRVSSEPGKGACFTIILPVAVDGNGGCAQSHGFQPGKTSRMPLTYGTLPHPDHRRRTCDLRGMPVGPFQ